MAFESVRGYVQLASGLGELTMAKALEAAQGLLAIPGADGVTRKVVQASTLAEELLDVARSNRANLVALVQGEVETALRRADVVRVADLEAARTALTGMSKELADLKALVVATGASAVAGASRGSRGRSGAVSTAARPAGLPDLEATTDTIAAAMADAVPDAASAAVPTPRAARRTSTAKAPAKKAAPRTATATKATAKKTTPRKATATKATATKATATKATAKKATAKKATAKKATAKKATANTTTAKKSTAKKSTARKATTKKATP